ncbi:hypothetical protein NOM73_12590 [Erwinia persicina]|uniref:hypothetical protein n=1 Tax=Erwinia persicina TaxID=55211 RepID=UPI00210D9AA3|nr:hypothetical protein [Erwinia persicina]MCQ4094519.1 hypothetical protein [Erwinia persicina]MCQ4101259.1 hypothetical protein [Erwinia persicina]
MSTTLVKLTNFAEVIDFLKTGKEDLKNKSEETRLLSYFFRRLPLYFGSVLCFLLILQLMILVKAIELPMMNEQVKSVLPHLRCWVWLAILVLLAVVNLWLRKKQKNTASKPSTDEIQSCKKKVSLCWKKIDCMVVSFIMQLALLFSVAWVLKTPQPVITGIALFGTVAIMAMIVNRTLGYTRRYERYQYFEDRMEQLTVQFNSFQHMNISFTELHIRELAALFEALASSKHNGTMGDSFYLLKQLEKRVAEL